jgi:hypothetical protein
MHRTATAALLLASALGCATAAPFQAGRPIEVEKKGLGNVYRQDGKPLDLWSTLAGLEAVEGARDDARAARHWAYGGVGAGLAGRF